ncbi:hypothetical protein [Bosea sp. AAP35]|uniref:hypothetical protein n=1 Tax=Bosea sp. AAP35 TaxID=1523417 RepID=UPI0012E12C92|nr:hypothetical protein [Bosea sp. AAP35]
MTIGCSLRLDGGSPCRRVVPACGPALNRNPLVRLTLRCAGFGLSPSRFERFSAYDMDGGNRMSRAQEIFLFKPAKQSQRLVRIIETIILRHVTTCHGTNRSDHPRPSTHK